jgi:mannose-6-phosphate isomerase-like protein (cupin superfamily)
MALPVDGSNTKPDKHGQHIPQTKNFESVTMGRTGQFTCRWIMQMAKDDFHMHLASDTFYHLVKGKGFLQTNDYITPYIANSVKSFTLAVRKLGLAFHNMNMDYSCLWTCHAPEMTYTKLPNEPKTVVPTMIQNTVTNVRQGLGVFNEVSRGQIILDNIEYPCYSGQRLGSTQDMVVVARSTCAFDPSKKYWHDQDVVIVVLSGGIGITYSGRTVFMDPEDVLVLSSGTQYIISAGTSESKMLYVYSPNPEGNYVGNEEYI